MNSDANIYQRLTIRCNGNYFSLFCKQESLEHRRDEVILWADKLARRLHWNDYKIEISSATEAQANERIHALFEHRYPANK